jgi:hypothetical protein
MKIIFLDIDGVLYTSSYHEYLVLNRKPERDKYGYIFDPNTVENFNEIIEKTEAKIVISSTWKRHGLDKIRKIFNERGIKGEIIGLTPTSTIDDLFFCRGEEIEHWLSYNGLPEKFVVIDDQSLGEGYDKWKGFFKTKFKDGITNKIKNNIINYLK